MQNNKSNMIVYRMPYNSITTSHPKSIFRNEKTIEIPESDYVLLFGYIQFPKYLYDLAKTLPLVDKDNKINCDIYCHESTLEEIYEHTNLKNRLCYYTCLKDIFYQKFSLNNKSHTHTVLPFYTLSEEYLKNYLKIHLS